MWIFIVFSELYSTLISGGEYGVSMYPFTNQLIELIVDPLTIFSLLLIIFYSSEIVWKECSLNFNLIIDATPIKNSVLFLSKFSAILLLPIVLITIGIIICIAFQTALGYSNYEFGLYASIYYHYGIQLFVFSMIALFVSSLAKSKYMGMGIFGLIVLLSMKSNLLGLEHPLTSLGFMPRVAYNNMDGFQGLSNLFNHLSLYWLTFGLLLVFISFKLWNRGVVASLTFKLKQFKNGFSTIQQVIFTVLIVLFISAGSLVFYNVNIISDYDTRNDNLDLSEDYERKFKTYEELERPIRTSIKTEVAMYPDERKYTVLANYILKNNSEKPISQIFITERAPLGSIVIENANLIMQDVQFGIYLFEFKNALQPNDSVKCNYELVNEIKGYTIDNSIVTNGSYINRFGNFEPIFGYSSGLEITDKTERRKRNLAERVDENTSDVHIVHEDFNAEKIKFETIISTDADQTAISSGSLIKEWTENNRNFYHFKTTNKIMPAVGYFSAKYKTKKTNYKGISIEQYYDKNHHFNIEDIEYSIKETLDYCQENFGAYNFDQVRIAEVPSHWPFGGFAHPGVISMTEDRLYLLDIRDEETFNLVAKRTIHEVAHQWWGHTLSAKPVAGGALFVEGLAKYTEAVVMEKMFGKRALFTLSENARSRYFTGRSFANGVEPPVYKIQGEDYLMYGKTYAVMLSLRDLIGESRVNKVLKSITEKYRYVNKLEANTIEFLEEIYKATPQEHHVLVDDWFKKVITYDLAIEESSYKTLANGTYEISVNIRAERFESLETGEINVISINEPIKIGVFNTHLSNVKDESSILYYESTQINKTLTEIKIIVKEKPSYISVDPFGTRSDENFVDNTFKF